MAHYAIRLYGHGFDAVLKSAVARHGGHTARDNRTPGDNGDWSRRLGGSVIRPRKTGCVVHDV
eukprot:4780270-Prymnesium_polylepis.1